MFGAAILVGLMMSVVPAQAQSNREMHEAVITPS